MIDTHSIELGIKFIKSAIIMKGENIGGVTRAIAYHPESFSDYKRFNARKNEIRIDYVQHALSALMLYRTFKN